MAIWGNQRDILDDMESYLSNDDIVADRHDISDLHSVRADPVGIVEPPCGIPSILARSDHLLVYTSS